MCLQRMYPHSTVSCMSLQGGWVKSAPLHILKLVIYIPPAQSLNHSARSWHSITGIASILILQDVLGDTFGRF